MSILELKMLHAQAYLNVQKAKLKAKPKPTRLALTHISFLPLNSEKKQNPKTPSKSEQVKHLLYR